MNRRKAVNKPRLYGPGSLFWHSWFFRDASDQQKRWHDNASRDVVHSEKKFGGTPRQLASTNPALRWINFPLHQQKRFA